MIPALRVGEVLIGVELVGDEERDVEENLPVIQSVGAVEIDASRDSSGGSVIVGSYDSRSGLISFGEVDLERAAASSG